MEEEIAYSTPLSRPIPALATKVLRVCAIALMFTAAVSLWGCGSGSSGESAIGSEEGGTTQRFIGHFSEAGSGSPYVEQIRLTLMNTGASAVSDSEGRVQIDTPGIVQGEAAIEVGMTSGTVMIYIRDLTDEAEIVSFEAEVSEDGTAVRVTSVRFARYGEANQELLDDWTTPERCLNCHGDFGAPICENRIWEGIHQGIWECTFELPPVEVEAPVGAGDGDEGSDDGSDDDDDRDPQSKTPKKCLQCHGDRGGPRCGNRRWEKLHSWYTCKKKGGKGKGKKSRIADGELAALADFLTYHNPEER